MSNLIWVQKQFLWILLCLALLPSKSFAKNSQFVPKPCEHYYGIYFQGAKVGWMRHTVKVGGNVLAESELEARVAGMGQVSHVRMQEHKQYDLKTGALKTLDFSQSAATGSVRIVGKKKGKTLVLNISAGGMQQQQEVMVTETLEDAFGLERLAKNAKPGQKASFSHFEASVQKEVQSNHVVLAVEKKVFGGVEVMTAKIETTYPDLGIKEHAWLDNTGKVLESQVGGVFLARLEPMDVAKKTEFVQDLLISAMVASPVPLSRTASMKALEIHLKGFTETTLPPTSPRQKVSTKGDVITVLNLSKDPEPKGIHIASLKNDNNKNQEFLQTTPFIQVDSKAIQKAARKAAGNSKDFFDIVKNLTKFVYAHVKDEYVPAYSNALEVLKSGRGDCTEHSVLFVALARALGIPARVAVGIAYWPAGRGFGWHAWAEVFANGRWYTVDPTWNQPVADVTHIKLAQGGPAQQARIVMLLGQLEMLKVEVL